MKFILPFVLVAALGARPSAVSAVEPIEVMDVYGAGVHAYFANSSSQAYQLLSQAIAAGSHDPRVYYFRGMALMRMGRLYEAESDFQVGASYEANDPDAYPVDRSLERVQGRERHKLEKFRRQAKFAAMQQRQSLQRARYESIEERAPKVLRQEVRFGVENLGPANSAGSGRPIDAPQIEDAPPRDSAPRPALDPTISDPASAPEAAPVMDDTDPFGGPAADVPEKSGTTEEDAAPMEDTHAPAGGDAFDPFADEPTGGDAASDSPAAEQPTVPDGAATDDGGSPNVEVGEQVKARRLIGILGGILGKTARGAIPQPKLPAGIPGGGPPPGAGDAPFGDPPPQSPPGTADQPAADAPSTQPDSDTADDPFADDPFGDDSAMPDDAAAEETAPEDAVPEDALPEENAAPEEPAVDDPAADAPATDDDPFADDPFGADAPSDTSPGEAATNDDSTSDDAASDDAPAEPEPSEPASDDDPFGFE